MKTSNSSKSNSNDEDLEQSELITQSEQEETNYQLINNTEKPIQKGYQRRIGSSSSYRARLTRRTPRRQDEKGNHDNETIERPEIEEIHSLKDASYQAQLTTRKVKFLKDNHSMTDNTTSHQIDSIESKPYILINRFKKIIFKFFSYFHRIIIWPLKWTFISVLPHTLVGILICSMIIITFYLLGLSFKNLLEKIIDSTCSLTMLLKPIRSISTPFIYLYCSILKASFCDSDKRIIHIGQVARTVSGTAQQASDIFDSVIQLSDPSNLGLHQTEILELAFAVRWSSDLPDKLILSDGLNDLSDLTLQLKDQLIDLNGKGINTFSFIAYQFSRLGDLIEWVQIGKKSYTTETIKQNLDLLFEDLSRELNKLLNTIERLIPIASRSTNLGIEISERLYRQHYLLINQTSKQTLWKKLLHLTSFQTSQLYLDLDLTAQSIKNLKLTWFQLENIRTDLLSYRNNVANFKASFIGWHLADHGLTPEDELISMREVIEKFQFTLKSVKSKSKSSNLLPTTSTTP